MSEDLKIELAKNEYINVINEINEKYGLSLSIVEMIITNILKEVTSMKNNNVKMEYEEYQKQQQEKEQEDKLDEEEKAIKKEKKDGNN